MTTRVQNSGYANTSKMANDLSPKKTMLIIVIVVGCFAVLWPKVFYPMMVGSANQHIKPSPIDKTTGCCDVISEKDVNTLKILSEICSTIIHKDEDGPLTSREMIAKCHSIVLDTCGIDISAVLQQQVQLGHTTKQILDQVRSLNGSLCLKYNFGVAPWRLGVPHRVTVKVSPSSIRQERPLHLRSEMVHPAFRERGRAIPPSHSSTPSRSSQPKVLPGRPGPIPVMRPTMGGAGHVVPAPKQSTGSMGLIMPIYTIGIVIFFTYTVMKIVFKKQPEALYPPVTPDPVFRKEVFESTRGHSNSAGARDGKLVVNAMSALLDEVDQEFASRRKATEVTDQDVMANGTVPKQDQDQPSVKVLGMEMTASCEGGKKWSRSGSPVLPTSHPPVVEKTEPPQEIFLEGSLPPQSHHLLVSDSATATETKKINSEEDPAVVLAGKMTLSVISLDSSENDTDDSKGEDKSSSNISEDFDKIDNEQLNVLREETESVVLNSNLLDEMKNKIEELKLKNFEEISDDIIQLEQTEQDDGDKQSKELATEKSDITEDPEKILYSNLNDKNDIPITSEEDIFKRLNEAISVLSKELKSEHSYDALAESSSTKFKRMLPVEKEGQSEFVSNIEVGNITPEKLDSVEDQLSKLLQDNSTEYSTVPVEKDEQPEFVSNIEVGNVTPGQLHSVEDELSKLLQDNSTEYSTVPVEKEEQSELVSNIEVGNITAEKLDSVEDQLTKSLQDNSTEYSTVPVEKEEQPEFVSNIEVGNITPEKLDSVENQLSKSLQDNSADSDLGHASSEVIHPDHDSEEVTNEPTANTENLRFSSTSEQTETAVPAANAELIVTDDETNEKIKIATSSENKEVIAEDDAKPQKTEVVEQDIEAVQNPLDLTTGEISDVANTDKNQEQVDEIEDDVEYVEGSDESIDDDINYAEEIVDRVVRNNTEMTNGREEENSQNGINNEEDELLEDENSDNSEEDDEEIEEIIEYVTDEEEDEEEIIETENRNNVKHLNENRDTT